MKKIFYIATICFATQIANAQYLYTSLGFLKATNASTSFESFFNSYNSINSGSLSTPFPASWPAAHGMENYYGMGVRKGEGFGMCCDLITGFTGSSMKTKAIFKNNESRNLKVKFGDWTSLVGVGVGSNKFFAEVTGGASIRFSTLYSSFTYSDGTESFGSDFKLNGIYSSLRAMGVYGFMAGVYPIQNVGVQFKATKVLTPTNDPSSGYLQSYDDLTEWKNDNSEYFPQDMVDYMNNPDNLFNNAYIDMHGWQMSMSLCFALPL